MITGIYDGVQGGESYANGGSRVFVRALKLENINFRDVGHSSVARAVHVTPYILAIASLHRAARNCRAEIRE